jgi:CRISPR system Cascade subunit CasA
MGSDRPSFSLVDEPWVPCLAPDAGARTRGQPSYGELSLRDTLTRAHDIVQLAGDNPLETVVILRLLLAVLYKAVGVTSTTDWGRVWQAGRFPADALTTYLGAWRARFDLFDPTRPFYQTATIGLRDAGSVAKLLFQADNNATLFDHTVVDEPPALTPAKAARSLLVVQAFDTSGTKTGGPSEKIAVASPLVQAAVLAFRGATLFETLMLNLHRYSPDRDGEPWAFRAENDLAAWEREEEVTTAARVPGGFVDLLTWQSRRVLLEPTPDATGAWVVRRAVVMKGESIAPAFERRNRETMFSFRQRRQPPPDQSPWFAARFEEDRASWRDCLALLSSLPEDTARCKGARWLAALMDEGILSSSLLLPVDLYGLATDKAKCLFWRHDQMTVPAGLLRDGEVAWDVARALQLAETVAPIVGDRWVQLPQSDGDRRASPTALAVVARGLITSDKELVKVVQQLSGARDYWTQLAVPFAQYLAALGQATSVDQSMAEPIRAEAACRWQRAVDATARSAFATIRERAGTRGKALQAVAAGERVFGYQLRLVIGQRVAPQSKEEVHAGPSD